MSKDITVKVNPNVPPETFVYHHSSKPQSLDAWKEPDSSIIVVSPNGKRTRLILP